MAKLFESIDAPPPAKTPAQLAAGQYIDAAKAIRDAVSQGVGVLARLAAQLGTAAILAEMSPDNAAGFAQCLPLLQQLWNAAAPDSVPFPPMPVDPPPPPPAPPAPPAPPDTAGGNGTDTTQGGAGN